MACRLFKANNVRARARVGARAGVTESEPSSPVGLENPGAGADPTRQQAPQHWL